MKELYTGIRIYVYSVYIMCTSNVQRQYIHVCTCKLNLKKNIYIYTHSCTVCHV